MIFLRAVDILVTLRIDANTSNNYIPTGWGVRAVIQNLPNLPTLPTTLNNSILQWCGPLGECTRSQGEYHALIRGLRQLKDHFRALEIDTSRVRIFVHGGKELIINQMRGFSTATAQHLKPLYEIAKYQCSKYAEVQFHLQKYARGLSALNLARDSRLWGIDGSPFTTQMSYYPRPSFVEACIMNRATYATYSSGMDLNMRSLIDVNYLLSLNEGIYRVQSLDPCPQNIVFAKNGTVAMSVLGTTPLEVAVPAVFGRGERCNHIDLFRDQFIVVDYLPVQLHLHFRDDLYVRRTVEPYGLYGNIVNLADGTGKYYGEHRFWRLM